jgi:hypothetical protein
MARKIRAVPKCDICGRLENDFDVLTDMHKPGTVESCRVCHKSECAERANAEGFFSRHQREQQRDNV